MRALNSYERSYRKSLCVGLLLSFVGSWNLRNSGPTLGEPTMPANEINSRSYAGGLEPISVLTVNSPLLIQGAPPRSIAKAENALPSP